jgi:polyisoprenyl-teichoic acid--peptidoglycan teichoic acid transferase
VKALVQQFLNVEDTPGPRGEAPARKTERKRRKRKRARPDASALGLFDATSLGQDQGLQAVQAGAGGSLPVLYPTLLLNSSEFAQEPRVYKIRGQDGKRYGAYRMVLRKYNANGEYYGLQGTTWQNPPILDNATQTRKIDGREYQLHYAGDRLRLVAWHTPKAAYWISNTLLQTLTNKQMLAIARSTRRCC